MHHYVPLPRFTIKAYSKELKEWSVWLSSNTMSKEELVKHFKKRFHNARKRYKFMLFDRGTPVCNL